MKKKSKLDLSHKIYIADYNNIDPMAEDIYILSISKDGFFDSHSYYLSIEDVKSFYEISKSVLESKELL